MDCIVVKREESPEMVGDYPEHVGSPDAKLKALAFAALCIQPSGENEGRVNVKDESQDESNSSQPPPNASQTEAQDTTSSSITTKLVCDDCQINDRRDFDSLCNACRKKCNRLILSDSLLASNGGSIKTEGQQEGVTGRNPCRRCLIRTARSGLKCCDNCRHLDQKRKQRRRQEARERGHCSECRIRPPSAGKKLCDSCRETSVSRRRSRRIAAVTKGLCSTCMKRPQLPGLKYCSECQRKEAGRKYRRSAKPTAAPDAAPEASEPERAAGRRDIAIADLLNSDDAVEGVNFRDEPEKVGPEDVTIADIVNPDSAIDSSSSTITVKLVCDDCRINDRQDFDNRCGPCREKRNASILESNDGSEKPEGQQEAVAKKRLCRSCQCRTPSPGLVTCDRCRRVRKDQRVRTAESGVCTDCRASPPAAGRKICEPCRVSKREFHRKYRADAAANGLCVRCRKYPPLAGIKSCAECRSRSLARWRKDRDRCVEANICTRCRKHRAAAGILTCETCRVYRIDLDHREGRSTTTGPDAVPEANSPSEPGKAGQGDIAIADIPNPDSVEDASARSEPKQVSRGIAITDILNPVGYEVETAMLDGRKIQVIALD